MAAASGLCFWTWLHGKTIPQTQHLDLNQHTALGEWRSADGLHVLLWALGPFVSQMSEVWGLHLDFPGHLPWGVCVVS